MVAKTLNDSSESADWVIIACFYSALHLVEAALDRKLGYHTEKNAPQNISIHGYRKKLIGTYYRKIFREYGKLFNDSVLARYLSDNSTGGVTLKKCSYQHFDKTVAQQRLNDLAKIRAELSD